MHGRLKNIEGYILDEKNRLYLAKEIFRGRLCLKNCPQCGELLFFVYSEAYILLGFRLVSAMPRIYGSECDNCKCCFVYDGEYG